MFSAHRGSVSGVQEGSGDHPQGIVTTLGGRAFIGSTSMNLGIDHGVKRHQEALSHLRAEVPIDADHPV
jgi:hypothetical protein